MRFKIYGSHNPPDIDYSDLGLRDNIEFERLVSAQEDVDEWGVVQCVCDSLDIGIEYNFCIEWYQGELYDNSAFYTMHYNPDTGYWETDYDDFISYKIDYWEPDWRQKIKDFAISLLEDKIAEL